MRGNRKSLAITLIAVETQLNPTENPPDSRTGKDVPTTLVTVKITEITGIIPYGFYLNGVPIVCDPTSGDISAAIAAKAFESRGFQSQLRELEAEWANSSSVEEYSTKVRTYHAQRIAHFVYHGWTEPIALTEEKKITDGLHRLRAAIHKGMLEVEATIS